jgi:hypothetical protein
MKASGKVVSTLLVLVIFFFWVTCQPCFAAQDSSTEQQTKDTSGGLVDDLGDDFQDDLGDDFQDGEESMQTISQAESEYTEKQSIYKIGGHLKIGSRYNYAQDKPLPGQTDWQEFSSLKSEILLELDMKLIESWQLFVSGSDSHDFIYRIHGRDTYTQEVLDDYESEVDLRKAYIRGSIFKSLDLKVGRQIVVWGKSDNIRVTDVLNPLEMREPGLTDLEDVRLPVAMTKLDFYYGKWGVSGIAVHEHRYNNIPAFGSDFYPYPIPPVTEEEPSAKFDNTEYALAVNGVFSGWDISFYYADIYNDESHLELFPNPALHHAGIYMLGSAFNIASGNWLYKTEGAYFDGIQISDMLIGMMPVFNTKDYARVDLLAGIEYSGFTDTTISIEAVNRYFTDYDLNLELAGEEENSFQGAVRLSRNFFNETLSLTFLVLWYGLDGDDGALFRLTSEYDLTDDIEITCGVVDYNTGDLIEFSRIGDNDRIYMNVKYSF